MPAGRIDRAQSTWRSSLQEFGELLQHKRVGVLRMTQAQMAARAGIDQSRISRIEAGQKPKDKATAIILAEAYQLTAAETNTWLDLLYGHVTFFANEKARHSQSEAGIGRAYALLEQLRHKPNILRAHDYFRPFPDEALWQPDTPSGSQVIAVIDWLLSDNRGLPRAHLLVEYAASSMHYLDRAGQHRRRLALALAAADAARELERRTVEGWLQSDAIPWTIMEHRHYPASAHAHLERGLALARELKNQDMEALARAILARAYLMAGNNRDARTNLSRARETAHSPAIRTRIDWIDGDLAMRQKQYDKAFILYRASETTDVLHGGGRHTVITPLLRLGQLHVKDFNLPAAKDAYQTLLTDVYPAPAGERRARILFELARVLRLEGNMVEARRLAGEAQSALAAADDDPQLRQIIDLFTVSLSA